ncbi:baculoviral IAP repeat-containing protein 8-like [Procambarus clarkii]|uniref:baculoviral IAP repeat-containing protein 8-like n=1 Tax=Procambarus clarkii TaxID=6728 RepID=UPI003742D500
MDPLCARKFYSIESLKCAGVRLQTFVDWPVKWLNPIDLVEDGFYYLRNSDYCLCAFCYCIVGAWIVGDTPRRRHKMINQDCAFIRGKRSDNVSLEVSEIAFKYGLEFVSHKIELGNKKISDSSGAPPKEDLGLIKFRKSLNPGLVTYKCRLETFDMTWPGSVKQTSHELAEAGFFYCGISDHVCCYHCACGIRNWRPEDDPWTLHARCSPECAYIILARGKEFVKNARLTIPLPIKPIDNDLINILMESMDKFKHLIHQKLIPVESIRYALSEYLKESRDLLPFIIQSRCLEIVLRYMQEGTDIYLRVRDLIYEAVDDKKEQEVTLEDLGLKTLPETCTNTVENKDCTEQSWEEDILCRVCMDKNINIVILPCKHMVTCSGCLLALKCCPICRGNILYIINPIAS